MHLTAAFYKPHAMVLDAQTQMFHLTEATASLTLKFMEGVTLYQLPHAVRTAHTHERNRVHSLYTLMHHSRNALASMLPYSLFTHHTIERLLSVPGTNTPLPRHFSFDISASAASTFTLPFSNTSSSQSTFQSSGLKQ